MAADRLLIVDDEKLIRWSIATRLREDGHEVLEAADGAAALRELGDDIDLVLLDHRLPDTDGLTLLERIASAWPDVSVVMLTAYGTVDDAVRAMKLGAFDYLSKPIDLDELAAVIGKALQATRLRREVHRLREAQRDAHGSIDLIGTSPPMRDVLALIDKVRASEASTVLLQGDSGTGKDVVAKAIHFGSPRAERPFVTITCSALTETLLESELFGHERGAFTDARTRKKGLFEIADGGTAFLDEIGEMGPTMQAKLLRLLEEKTFKRVGGTRDIRVDVRVIAATNRRLEQAVAENRFRADLFYRLNVIPIELPPLSERGEDIPLLVQHFIEQFNRQMRRGVRGVSPQALDRMCAYGWPGNIRELRNVIERIMILESTDVIGVGDLPAEIAGESPDAAGDAPDEIAAPPRTLAALERGAIRDALHESKGNQVRAAHALGVSRDTLRYRMKKYGLG